MSESHPHKPQLRAVLAALMPIMATVFLIFACGFLRHNRRESWLLGRSLSDGRNSFSFSHTVCQQASDASGYSPSEESGESFGDTPPSHRRAKRVRKERRPLIHSADKTGSYSDSDDAHQSTATTGLRRENGRPSAKKLVTRSTQTSPCDDVEAPPPPPTPPVGPTELEAASVLLSMLGAPVMRATTSGDAISEVSVSDMPISSVGPLARPLTTTGTSFPSPIPDQLQLPNRLPHIHDLGAPASEEPQSSTSTGGDTSGAFAAQEGPCSPTSDFDHGDHEGNAGSSSELGATGRPPEASSGPLVGQSSAEPLPPSPTGVSTSDHWALRQGTREGAWVELEGAGSFPAAKESSVILPVANLPLGQTAAVSSLGGDASRFIEASQMKFIRIRAKARGNAPHPPGKDEVIYVVDDSSTETAVASEQDLVHLSRGCEQPRVSSDARTPFLSPSTPEHPFYRIPRVDSAEKQERRFSPRLALHFHSAARRFLSGLQSMRELLACETLNGSQLDHLAKILQQLCAYAYFFERQSTKDKYRYIALPVLARRYLILDGIICGLQVLGESPSGEWWTSLTNAINDEDTEAPEHYVRGERAIFNRQLSSQLSKALQTLKTGVRLSMEETVDVKRKLFCFSLSPSVFWSPEWNPWRADDEAYRKSLLVPSAT
ncbi:hypothetical protein Efla_007754 [Eimeria flavescens]